MGALDDFDPDAYLAKKRGAPPRLNTGSLDDFDPDAYLASRREARNPEPRQGMGDLRMAESQPLPSNPILPGRERLGQEAAMHGEKVNPVMGALTTVGDVMNIPTRAVAKLRGQEMDDPDAYFFRPEAEAFAHKAQAQGDKMAQDAAAMPTGTWGDNWAQGQAYNRAGQSMAAAQLAPMIGQVASDPGMVLSIGGKAIVRLGKKGIEALHAAIPGLKNYVSGLSQINPQILEKAATPEGMAAMKEGAAMDPADLAQQIADDASKVDRYREDLARNSRITQEDQVKSMNADLARDHQKVTAELGERADNQNAFRTELADNSRGIQRQQTEQGILDARKQATGAQDASLSEIKPGALGEDLKSTVMGGKAEMQDAWLQGDQKSVGPYRAAPAPVMKAGGRADGAKVEIKVLTDRLGKVLDKYKAYDPTEGMRKVSEGGASVVRDLMGYAQESGHTVDDLLNIKAELRRARNMDKYKGVPFDLSVDDVMFGDADREISSVIDLAIRKAAPKEAGQITDLMRAKDRHYAIAKDLLGDQARSLGQTVNSAAIIQKVKNMGPERAREIIAAAESNPAIASLVPKLRQAFVDDLILTAMKDGEFDPKKMHRLWSAPGMQEMKAAWLGPDDLTRIDEALALGTSEISNPAQVFPTKVPRPAELGTRGDLTDGFGSRLARQESDAPPKAAPSFSYGGKPDPVTAKSRVENIGNENEINQRALAELKTLDKINGTNHTEQAMKIFESGKIGMDKAGRVASTPMSNTGRSALGSHIGTAVGGTLGAAIGILSGTGLVPVVSAAGGGAVLAKGIQSGIQGAMMYGQSPAGAVAAYRVMNRWAAKTASRTARAASAVQALQKTQDKAVRAKLIVLLQKELEKSGQMESDQ